jgi:hypothetical protein
VVNHTPVPPGQEVLHPWVVAILEQTENLFAKDLVMEVKIPSGPTQLMKEPAGSDMI